MVRESQDQQRTFHTKRKKESVLSLRLKSIEPRIVSLESSETAEFRWALLRLEDALGWFVEQGKPDTVSDTWAGMMPSTRPKRE